jgi:DDE superfamily endonuclease
MVDPEAAAAQSEGRDRGGAGGLQKKVAEVVAEEAQAHPGVKVEAFATDEHRIGLKPVVRCVWAPVGVRPVAHGHHRFEWLYVTAFVSPATGECFWYLSNGVSKPFFEALLAAFAKESGAGRDRIIVLVLDNAGWHGQANLKVPDGIRLLFLPPYTPELQPAEHLWEVVDEPIINQHIADIETLDAIIAKRCVQLANDRQTIKGRAGFHWWPKIANAS